MTTFTRTELQTALKSLRNDGYELQVKLTASTDRLQLEYDRVMSGKANVEYDNDANESALEITASEGLTEPQVDLDNYIADQAEELAPEFELTGQSSKLTSDINAGYINTVHSYEYACPLTCDVLNGQCCKLTCYGGNGHIDKPITSTELTMDSLQGTPLTFANDYPSLSFKASTVDMVRNFRISLLALLAVVVDALAVVENNERVFRQRGILYARKTAKQTANATYEFMQGFLYGLTQDYRNTLN